MSCSSALLLHIQSNGRASRRLRETSKIQALTITRHASCTVKTSCASRAGALTTPFRPCRRRLGSPSPPTHGLASDVTPASSRARGWPSVVTELCELIGDWPPRPAAAEVAEVQRSPPTRCERCGTTGLGAPSESGGSPPALLQ